jgi:signal transduction histidine kinase
MIQARQGDRDRKSGKDFPSMDSYDATQQPLHEGPRPQSHDLGQASAAPARFGSWSLEVKSRQLTWWQQSAGPRGVARTSGRLTAGDLLRRYAPEDRALLRAACRRCIEDGTPFDLQVHAVGASGRRKGLRVIGVAARGPGGEVLRVQGAFQDLHRDAALERRESERTQLRMDEELAAITQALANELRSPLAHVEGFSRALSERLPADADPQLHHFAARVRAGAARMEGIVDALLQLSRIGGSELHLRHVDLSAVARDTVEALWMHQARPHAHVEIETGLRAWGDARLLRTLLEQLVGNAWKSAVGSASARIAIGQRPDGAFYVRDNRPGNEERAPEVTGPMSPQDAGDTRVALAIARRVVERHGGLSWTETVPGTATVFCFRLPEGP